MHGCRKKKSGKAGYVAMFCFCILKGKNKIKKSLCHHCKKKKILLRKKDTIMTHKNERGKKQ